MKRQYNFLSIMLAAGLLTACSSDEPSGNQQLPAGKYPLQMTATVGSLQSRTGGMDAWHGGEEIAVSIGDYTGKYILDAAGNATASGSPYYWQNTAPATVTAWYPYDEGEQTYNISDQSQGYAEFDLLYAETEGSYAAPVNLAFSHQMAKVSYTLVKGHGITDTEFAAATVTLLGDKSVAVSGGKIISTATSQTDEIKPYHDVAAHTGSAVVAPQDMTGKPLIKVRIDGNVFIYTPNTEAAGNLQAGYQHSYTITVKATGIEVVSAATGGVWTDDGSEDVGIAIIYDGTETEAKVGDYYYSDGTWSDGGLRKLYSDGTSKWTEPTPQPVPDKTCIGIVFYVGHHPADQSNYMLTGIGREKCNGYVVALQDATDSRIVWGDSRKELGCYPTDADGNKQNNYDNPDSDWCGYAWTQKIITAVGGKDNLDDMISPGYPATWYAVVSYETGCKAPSNSSGWFLPSIGQMWKIYQNRSTLFDSKSVGTGLKSGYNVGYWSSSEFYYSPVRLALNVHADRAKVFNNVKDVVYYYTVRPVLAF